MRVVEDPAELGQSVGTRQKAWFKYYLKHSGWVCVCVWLGRAH